MQAGQRKGAQVVIEAHIGLPGLYTVAVTATGTERLLVCIVTTMAGYAGRLQLLLFCDPLVASHAGGFSMGTEQRELRFFCVIELRIVPGLGRMAVFALGPVPATVCVITPMAVDTGLASGLFEIFSGVAGLTGESPMACRQRETGFLCMVEGQLFPCTCPMTVFARRAALTLVRIVDAVTRHAGRGCVFVALPGMTQATFNLVMGTGQRVTLVGGFGVIEPDFPPGHDVVTADTILTQGFLVDVLFRMTTDAGRWRIAMLCLWLVTITTVSASMPPLQRIVGKCVIKSLWCKTHNVCATAFMVGMAIPAFPLSRLL